LTAKRSQLLAGHATDIAEEVVYRVEGEIIRHAPYPQDSHAQKYRNE
jgi:hypothetical protein